MTTIPDKTILNGSSNPTTSQFKSQMGQLWDYLNERNNVNASASGLTVSANKKLLGRNTSGAGAIEEITYTDQGYAMLTEATQLGFRNKIINGDMRIDQRNNGAAQSINNTTAYALDRWRVNFTGGTGTVQRVTGSGDFRNAMRLTGGAGITAAFVGQRFESWNIGDLAGKTVSVRVRLSASALTSINWVARFPTAQDNYSSVTEITNGSITINSTPTDYSFQITLPSGVTNGLEIYFQTPGGFTSGTIDVTGVQLEVGSIATPFEHRPYGVELGLCRRYGRPMPSGVLGQAFGVSTSGHALYLDTPLRSSPTLNTTSGFSVSTAGGVSTSATPSISALNDNLLYITTSGASSLTAGHASILNAPTGAFLSAEL